MMGIGACPTPVVDVRGRDHNRPGGVAVTTARHFVLFVALLSLPCVITACGAGDMPGADSGGEADLAAPLPDHGVVRGDGGIDLAAPPDSAPPGCGMACVAPTPFCDQKTGRCVGCRGNADCADGS